MVQLLVVYFWPLVGVLGVHALCATMLWAVLLFEHSECLRGYVLSRCLEFRRVLLLKVLRIDTICISHHVPAVWDVRQRDNTHANSLLQQFFRWLCNPKSALQVTFSDFTSPKMRTYSIYYAYLLHERVGCHVN